MVVTRLALAASVLGGSTMAWAQLAPPPPPTPPAPPPVVTVTHDHAPPSAVPPAPSMTMVTWSVSEARCAAGPVASLRAPNPLPVLGWGSAAADKPVAMTFAIEASGRPLSIARAEKGWSADAGDLMPALAAARFAPGAARSGCSITFTPVRQPLDQVPVELAMAYSVFPTGYQRSEALWDRIRPAGSTCFKPAPQLLNRAFPDFTALPGEQGRPLWSMVAYDIDAGGKPVKVRTVSGSRSAALDAASRKAVEQSRFGKGARQGCLYPYWKIADPLPAPDAPPRENFPAQPAACSALGAWVRRPVLRYPDNYRRRGVEGWAVLSYDVAPWGAIGNVTVLRAEPTSDFGDAGRSVLSMATRPASTAGASGCIERVRYVMGKPGEAPKEDVGPTPLY